MDMWNDDWWVITEMLTVKDGEVTHDGWLMVDGWWVMTCGFKTNAAWFIEDNHNPE
jgi:hypothetical protein